MTLKGAEASNNLTGGISVREDAVGTLTSAISRAKALANTGHGIDFDENRAGAADVMGILTAKVSQSTSSDNGGAGVRADSQTPGVGTLLLTNVTLEGNTGGATTGGNVDRDDRALKPRGQASFPCGRVFRGTLPDDAEPGGRIGGTSAGDGYRTVLIVTIRPPAEEPAIVVCRVRRHERRRASAHDLRRGVPAGAASDAMLLPLMAAGLVTPSLVAVARARRPAGAAAKEERHDAGVAIGGEVRA